MTNGRSPMEAEKVEELRRDLASSNLEDVSDTIIDIGKVWWCYELREDVARFLTHPNSELRGAAIQVLGFYWKEPEYREVADKMWRTDPDEHVRSVALMAWTGYFDKTRDPQVMRLLYDLLRDSNQIAMIRAGAYASLFSVFGLPASERPRMRAVYGKIETGVDWALVNRLMEEVTKENPK